MFLEKFTNLNECTKTKRKRKRMFFFFFFQVNILAIQVFINCTTNLKTLAVPSVFQSRDQNTSSQVLPLRVSRLHNVILLEFVNEVEMGKS